MHLLTQRMLTPSQGCLGRARAVQHAVGRQLGNGGGVGDFGVEGLRRSADQPGVYRGWSRVRPALQPLHARLELAQSPPVHALALWCLRRQLVRRREEEYVPSVPHDSIVLVRVVAIMFVSWAI